MCVCPCAAAHGQVDATGAGDAFFGGVVAAVNRWGFPYSGPDLRRIGVVASAAGAACVEVVGALPLLGVRCAGVAARLCVCCVCVCVLCVCVCACGCRDGGEERGLVLLWWSVEVRE
jgi:hypothetical protein